MCARAPTTIPLRGSNVNTMKEHIDFFKIAIKDYKVGALTRISKHVVKRIVKEIKPEYKYIVEYGAGDGVTTIEMLEALPQDGKLVAIDLNDNFIKELHKIKDPRLIVVKGDIVELSKNLKALGVPELHMVVSSVPFTIFSPKIRREIMENTYKALNQGGKIAMYQYSPLMHPVIKRVFGNSTLSFEARNFPPVSIMVGEKRV